MSATEYEVELADSLHLTIRVIERQVGFEDIVQERTFSLRRTQFVRLIDQLSVWIYERVNGELVRKETICYEFESENLAKHIQAQIGECIGEVADKNNIE